MYSQLICWLSNYLNTCGLLVIFRLRGVLEHRISRDYFKLLQGRLGYHCWTHLRGNSPSPCGTTAVRLWPLSGGGLCAEWSLRGDRGTHWNVGCSRYKKKPSPYTQLFKIKNMYTYTGTNEKSLISVQVKIFLTGEQVYLISYFLDISFSTHLEHIIIFSTFIYTYF